MNRIWFGALALCAGWGLPVQIGHAGGVEHWAAPYVQLESLPIQNGGRIKPLEAFASETVLYISGSRSLAGMPAVEVLLSWIAEPAEWEKLPLIQIGREDTKRQLGLDVHAKLFSLETLLKHSALPQYAAQFSDPKSPGQKSGAREQELRSVVDRIGVYRALTSGEAWTLVPSSTGQTAWESLVGPAHPVRQAFALLLKSYVARDLAGFEAQTAVLQRAVSSQIPGWNEGVQNRVQLEVLFLKTRPFLWAWIFYLTAALCFGLARRFRRLERVGLGMIAFAFLIHILGMAVRSWIAGRPPVSNMYESVVWVSFGVIFFAGILYWRQKQIIGLWAGSVIAALTLIAGDLAPAVLDPHIRPLVPVLRSNFWLTIHVLTITLGYAALALTLGIADVSLYQQLRRAPSKVVVNLNGLSYRAMQFGVVLLAAGTILGGIWADYSWGRFWGWDPKEVWALIALLSYLVVLHGRYTSWMGALGFAAATVVAFTSVVMAWYGVNFVLGVGLHSYGFASGGRGAVFTVVGLQLLYVGAIVAIVMRRKRA